MTSSELDWTRSLEAMMGTMLRGKDLALVQFHVDGMVLAIADQPDMQQSSLETVLNRLKAAPRNSTDKYVAWCVVDCLLKSPEVPLSMKTALMKDLPNLLVHHMDVATAAVDGDFDLRFLYYEMMRSWMVQSLLGAETQRLCEGHLKHSLVPARESNGQATGAAAAVGKVLAGIPASEAKGAASASSVERGEKAVLSLLEGLYDDQRSRFCCIYCGAYFTSEAARDEHHLLHTLSQRTERHSLVMTRTPTIRDFVLHRCSNKDGKFVRSMVNLEEIDAVASLSVRK